jgi:hypothetical protein
VSSCGAAIPCSSSGGSSSSSSSSSSCHSTDSGSLLTGNGLRRAVRHAVAQQFPAKTAVEAAAAGQKAGIRHKDSAF